MATLALHYTGQLHVAEAGAHACLFCLTDADVNIDDSAELKCLCCIVTPGVAEVADLRCTDAYASYAYLCAFG